jgi:predicted RNA methylase
MDARDLGALSDTRFDAVLDKSTLDALMDGGGDRAEASVLAMLREAWRVLKPGGLYLGWSLHTEAEVAHYVGQELGWQTSSCRILNPNFTREPSPTKAVTYTCFLCRKRKSEGAFEEAMPAIEGALTEAECEALSAQQGNPLGAALAEACLGDLVTVEVEGHGAVVLAARVDEAGGGLLWETLTTEGAPSSSDLEAQRMQTLAAHLRTKVWVAPMLRDAERNAKYAETITRVVQTLPGSRRGRLVLDIGTGTGLLAMLAARAGAEQVVACEMFPAVAALAEAVVGANLHLWPHSTLEVHCLHSKDLKVDGDVRNVGGVFLPRRADLLVSELLDSTLLAEGLLPTVRDAWKRLLRPGARVVPAGCRVWAQVVQCSALRRLQTVFDLAIPRVAQSSGGSDVASSVTLARSADAYLCPFTTAVPVRLQALPGFSANGASGDGSGGDGNGDNGNGPLGGDFLALSAPFLALELDLSCESALPPHEGCTRTLDVRATAAGQPHAVIYWFDLVLLKGDDKISDVLYSTHPGTQSWQDHWLHAAVPLPGAPAFVDPAAGVPLRLQVSHDDTALWFAALPPPAAASSAGSERSGDRRSTDETLVKRMRSEVPSGEVSNEADRKRTREEGGGEGGGEGAWRRGSSRPICTCGLHLAHSAQRLQSLADPLRAAAWATAIDHALLHMGPNDAGACVSALDVSDGSLLAVVTAARGVARVVSLEERAETSLVWAQVAAQQFDQPDNAGDECNDDAGEGQVDGVSGGESVLHAQPPAIEVLLARAEQIELPGGSPLELVLFDGCARGMEHRPCHSALHYWHLLRALQSRGAVDLQGGFSRSVPSAARIMGAAFVGGQLSASYGKVGNVCGFDHSALDATLEEALGLTGSTAVASASLHLALSEYSSVREVVGSRRTLLTLDYQSLTAHGSQAAAESGAALRGPDESALQGEAVVAEVNGGADVAAFWVELDLGPPGLTLACGPTTRGFNQAVCLLRATPPSRSPFPAGGPGDRLNHGALPTLRMTCDFTGGQVRFGAAFEARNKACE